MFTFTEKCKVCKTTFTRDEDEDEDTFGSEICQDCMGAIEDGTVLFEEDELFLDNDYQDEMVEYARNEEYYQKFCSIFVF